jgi:hypothetical protein
MKLAAATRCFGGDVLVGSIPAVRLDVAIEMALQPRQAMQQLFGSNLTRLLT